MTQLKIIITILVVLLLYLQFKLWVGDGGIPDVMHVQKEINTATIKKNKLQERNKALAAEVRDLKQGLEAIEERARNELGMIKEGETFYQIIKPKSTDIEIREPADNKRLPLKSPSD